VYSKWRGKQRHDRTTEGKANMKAAIGDSPKERIKNHNKGALQNHKQVIRSPQKMIFRELRRETKPQQDF
jgi:hypothetical protein